MNKLLKSQEKNIPACHAVVIHAVIGADHIAPTAMAAHETAIVLLSPCRFTARGAFRLSWRPAPQELPRRKPKRLAASVRALLMPGLFERRRKVLVSWRWSNL